MHSCLDAAVFDFDGVLNRNYDQAGFFWSRRLMDDHGVAGEDFARAFFGESFNDLLTGKADLKARLEALLPTLGCATPADSFMDYWFANDLAPCPDALRIVGDLRARGLRCVVGTNNERHRADFLWENLLKHHADHMYAAGPMGVAKPDARFFTMVREDLIAKGWGCTDPARLVLVDDIEANVIAARAAGWQAIHYGDYATKTLGDPAALRAALGL